MINTNFIINRKRDLSSINPTRIMEKLNTPEAVAKNMAHLFLIIILCTKTLCRQNCQVSVTQTDMFVHAREIMIF